MARKLGHECACEVCRDGLDSAVVEDHRQLNALLDRLDEQQRRWVAAREAMKLGHGGIALIATITGLHHETIRRGRDEINKGFADRPTDRIRSEGGGRPVPKKRSHADSDCSNVSTGNRGRSLLGREVGSLPLAGPLQKARSAGLSNHHRAVTAGSEIVCAAIARCCTPGRNIRNGTNSFATLLKNARISVHPATRGSASTRRKRN